MISNFKLFPYFNISQNFVQNVQKKKKKNLCPELASYAYVSDARYTIMENKFMNAWRISYFNTVEECLDRCYKSLCWAVTYGNRRCLMNHSEATYLPLKTKQGYRHFRHTDMFWKTGMYLT